MTKPLSERSYDIKIHKVEYRYCLSCDSAMSERIQYNSSNAITSWERYEYDGLNLLRADERYNPSGEAIDSGDPWRTIEVNTHRPGQIGALAGKTSSPRPPSPLTLKPPPFSQKRRREPKSPRPFCERGIRGEGDWAEGKQG